MELILLHTFTRWLPRSSQPPSPTAFPSPLRCRWLGHTAFTVPQVPRGRPTTGTATIATSLSLIGSLPPVPPGDCASPP